MEMPLGIFIDFFGFLIWIFLIGISIRDIEKGLKKWPRYILLMIGTAGVILDGILIVGFYKGWNLLVEDAWLFDHLGIPVFLYITWFAIKGLKNKKIKKKKTRWILLGIGIAGLLADGLIILMRWMK
jgi:hypothetical protein